MDKDEQIQELKNDCKRLAAELDYIGVADEELMYPELYKKYLREPEQRSETRPHETIVMCENFYSEGDTTSATKCKFCGKEKWEHPNT